MAGETGERKDKSITERNLKALRKIKTSTEFIKNSWWLIKVKGKSQITIPKDIRKILGIHVGDFLAASIENRKLVLTLKLIVSKEEVVLSKSGEKKMEEALDDIKKGRIEEVE